MSKNSVRPPVKSSITKKDREKRKNSLKDSKKGVFNICDNSDCEAYGEPMPHSEYVKPKPPSGRLIRGDYSDELSNLSSRHFVRNSYWKCWDAN